MQTVRGQRLNRGANLKSPSWEAIIREPADYPDPAARAACAMAVRSRTSRIFPASDRRRKDFGKKSRVRFGTHFRWTVSFEYPETNKTLMSGRPKSAGTCPTLGRRRQSN